MHTRAIVLASFALALGCQPQDRTMERVERVGEPTRTPPDQQVIIDRTDDPAAMERNEVTLRQDPGDQVAWSREEGIEDQEVQLDPQQDDDRVQQLAMRATEIVDQWDEPPQMRQRREGQPTQPGTQPGQPGTQPGQPGTQPGQPGTQPGQPGTQPGQPGTQPGIQGTQPGQPGAQPGQPGAQPGQPGAQPGQQQMDRDAYPPASGQQPVGRDGVQPRDAHEGMEPGRTAGMAHGEPVMTSGQLQVTLVNARADADQQQQQQQQRMRAQDEEHRFGQTTADRVDLNVNFQDPQGREIRLQSKRAVRAPQDVQTDENGAITSWGEGEDAEYGVWFVADLVVDDEVMDADRLVYLSAQPLDHDATMTDPATGQRPPPGQTTGPQGQPVSPHETQAGTPRDRAAAGMGDQVYAVHLVALPVSMVENQPGRAEPLRILQDLQAHGWGARTAQQQQQPGTMPATDRPGPGQQQTPAGQQPGDVQPGAQPGPTGEVGATGALDILHIVFGDARVVEPAVSKPAG